MKANYCLQGIIVLAIAAMIFLSGCIRSGERPQEESLKISDIKIEPIDENTVRINWSTNRETYSGIDIDEPDKLIEIFKKEFSCNIAGDLIIQQSIEESFKIYGCTFLKNNEGVPNLIHDGISYDSCMTDSRYLLCKGSENAPGKKHTVLINVLQPNTEYAFHIRATFESPDGWHNEQSDKTVVFRMPEK